MAKPKASHGAANRALRELGLKYPGAHLKSPWPDHMDLAVNDKTFAYMSGDKDACSISCKLPHSNAIALSMPHTEPTGYGLGKSGWVTATVPLDEDPPVELFKAWIDESYRAQAPKKLIAAMTGTAPAKAGKPAQKPAAKKAPAKKAAAKKAPAKQAAAKKPARKR